MSYSRRYSEDVYGSVPVRYRYPPSEDGGYIEDDVEIRIPVTIDIDVDTSQFDYSVDSFKSNINLLQGSVTGAEAAHIAAKIQSSNDIADSMVKGFYGLIQSEIGQQISEMMPKVEALTVELIQHQEACLGKKVQFEEDFNRILQRYQRLFDDLDSEMKTRVLSLNQSATSLQALFSDHLERYFKSPGVIVATVHLKERQEVTAKIVASGLKRKALKFLSNAKQYLNGQREISNQLLAILETDNSSRSIKENLPFLFIETTDVEKNVRRDVITSEVGKAVLGDGLRRHVDTVMNQNASWHNVDEKHRGNLDQYLNMEMAKFSSNAEDESSKRVLDWVGKLWKGSNGLQTNI